ncbi:hypothetical protein B4U80_15049 [Leptotrombidium deliense]|uniref:Integrase catalytic domain-containing protein n=1 Tax=Leptotrombidium deliense TaxID=299467 RepID=A0A443RSK7_9ACAR|nr:hypothetical protein B4U80_15049 [Leptotrombidium deliense]
MRAKIVPKNDALTGLRFLETFAKHCNGREVLNDNGKNFVSSTFANILAHRNFKHRFTTAYDLQANGLNEKANGTGAKVEIKFTAGKWSSYVSNTCDNYNNPIHFLTGYTPSLIFNGSDIHTPQTKSTEKCKL